MIDVTGLATMELDEAVVQDLRSGLRGELLREGDPGYDAARMVFNRMIDRRPALIVRCADTADVIQALNFARDNGLQLSVKGGGHNVAGHAVVDGGLLIDLSPMKEIRVDSERQVARAQPGVLLGELDRATQAYGLATPLGIISHTGIAGLTLGGGIGWLNGKFGLACDNLISVDIVTANGRFLTASADANEDLFWAVRGGGGNFGIVTAFEYRLHPVSQVLGGMVIYPMSQAAEVLRFYDGFARDCPDELSTMALLVTAPDGNPVIAVAACYCGALEDGEKALQPLRSFGPPVADLIQPMNYADMQNFFDGAFPGTQLHYWKANFVRRLSEEAIETLVTYAASKPSPASAIGLQHMHGAASRVGPAETAFAHRHEQFDLGILSIWNEPAESAQNITWARDLWEAIQPYVEQSVYVNNLGEEGEERVRAAYGPNYERLVAVKNKYDPANLFRMNQNIKPTL